MTMSIKYAFGGKLVKQKCTVDLEWKPGICISWKDYRVDNFDGRGEPKCKNDILRYWIANSRQRWMKNSPSYPKGRTNRIG